MDSKDQVDQPEDLYQVNCYRIEESVGYLIKRVRLALGMAVDREMADFDISHDQWGILIMLSQGSGDTAAELSREMGSDTGSMTRMIDRLEAKGWVSRKRCAEDRRIVRLELTEAGKELADRLPQVMVRVLNRHLTGFSHEELDLFKHFLRRMLTNAAQEERRGHHDAHRTSGSAH
jgi:DNA-binding MarR family transcriptional regulator